MPMEGATKASRLMCIFKIAFAFLYLAAINYGSILYPKVVFREPQNWFDSGEYALVYQTAYELNWCTIGMNLTIIGAAMGALFVACRCKFFGTSDAIVMPIEGQWRHWKYLLLPCLLNLLSYWLVTTSIAGMEIWDVLDYIDAKGIVEIYRDLLVIFLVKCLIGVNICLVSFRGYFLLRDFSQDMDCPLFNEYDFGEHLNMIFRV